MLVLGVLGVAASAYYVLVGDYSTALWAGLAGALSLLHSRVWGSPFLSSVVLWALVVVGLLGLGRPAWWVVGVLGLVALALIAVFEVTFGLRVLRRWRTITVEPARLGTNAGAETAIEAFESEGFRRVGAYGLRMSEGVSAVAVLLGPDADRLVRVDDGTAQVVSRFGERVFVTVDYAHTPVPPDVLRQEVYGWPDELAATHQTALALLAAGGLRPEPFRKDVDALEAARGLDERTFRFNSAHLGRSLLRMYVRTWRVEITQRSAEPVLGDDDRSLKRIDAWLGSTAAA